MAIEGGLFQNWSMPGRATRVYKEVAGLYSVSCMSGCFEFRQPYHRNRDKECLWAFI